MGSILRAPQMGVYAITHAPSGRQYVGASLKLKIRWQEHRAALRRGDHPNRALQQAWNETKPAEWSWSVLEPVGDRGRLAACERRWHERLRPVFNANAPRLWRDDAYIFDEQRFWSRMRQTDDCWEWSGCLSSVGYGKVSYRGQSDYAHRVAWIITYGSLSQDMCVLHRCDNRKCCRRDHLFLGSKTDNAADRQRKGRQRSGTVPRERTWNVLHPELVPRGEDHPGAKLTVAHVRSIRARYVAGETKSALARAYGVHRSTIGKVLARHLWRHVS